MQKFTQIFCLLSPRSGLYEDEEDDEEDDEEYFDFDPLDYLECREEYDSWFDAYPDWLQAWEHNGFR